MNANRKLATAVILICFALAAGIQAQSNPDLAAELEERFESDQSQRRKMHEARQQHGADSPQMKELWEKQSVIDEENMQRLVEIIEEHGWPGRTLVGDRGATGAFLILQHADHSYQKEYLPLVREAVAGGELGGDSLALLEDRVLMREGENQIYGTQLRGNSEGTLELWPIEDEANVDRRRAEVGLPPLAEYLKHFGLEYQPPKEE